MSAENRHVKGEVCSGERKRAQRAGEEKAIARRFRFVDSCNDAKFPGFIIVTCTVQPTLPISQPFRRPSMMLGIHNVGL